MCVFPPSVTILLLGVSNNDFRVTLMSAEQSERRRRRSWPARVQNGKAIFSKETRDPLAIGKHYSFSRCSGASWSLFKIYFQLRTEPRRCRGNNFPDVHKIPEKLSKTPVSLNFDYDCPKSQGRRPWAVICFVSSGTGSLSDAVNLILCRKYSQLSLPVSYRHCIVVRGLIRRPERISELGKSAKIRDMYYRTSTTV